MKFFLIFLIYSISANTLIDFCNNKDLGRVPVLAKGRVKPLAVLSQETLKYLTGKSGNPSEFCLQSFRYMGVPVKEIKTPILHTKLRKLLEAQSMTFSDLVDKESKLRRELSMQRRTTSYKKSLEGLLGKISVYNRLTTGQSWTFPVKEGNVEHNKVFWVPHYEFFTQKRVEASKAQNPFWHLTQNAWQYYESLGNTDHKTEYTYFKLNLLSWSIPLILLALSLLVGFKSPLPGAISGSIVLIVQIIAITIRISISQRAPITNMYETVMFGGVGALVFGLLLGHIRKEKILLGCGMILNLLALLMIRFANNMLDSSISPLVPVLRDNFWLSTHVTTIILSYSALGLSWVLSNLFLFKNRFTKSSAKELKHMDSLLYTSLKWGTTLLIIGIILGGIWADYSWGRFWGWDPKETWSLIVFCLYMAMLHARKTKWLTPTRFINYCSLAFLSVMMAWFGVNYILASGLHSYGFSDGGAIFLGSFFAIQFLIYFVFRLRPAHQQ